MYYTAGTCSSAFTAARAFFGINNGQEAFNLNSAVFTYLFALFTADTSGFAAFNDIGALVAA